MQRAHILCTSEAFLRSRVTE
uniref:Uncharacterized protein n=1 Tax=Anguilla anguilla TaxID=7936 RepID=A0A0E9QJJ6_ANGAN